MLALAAQLADVGHEATTAGTRSPSLMARLMGVAEVVNHQAFAFAGKKPAATIARECSSDDPMHHCPLVAVVDSGGHSLLSQAGGQLKAAWLGLAELVGSRGSRLGAVAGARLS